jgi:hypothetical protein
MDAQTVSRYFDELLLAGVGEAQPQRDKALSIRQLFKF